VAIKSSSSFVEQKDTSRRHHSSDCFHLLQFQASIAPTTTPTTMMKLLFALLLQASVAAAFSSQSQFAFRPQGFGLATRQ
jgi:hypothetical protein